MEMNQIRYFLAVCEHHNFSHAASASNVSQPSLTTSIKKLEAELGGALFIRDRAGCSLTSLGKLMHPRLERIHKERLEATAEAVRYAKLDRIPIRIGIGETIGQSHVTEALERFRERCPSAEIELIVEPAADLLSGLRKEEFDIAVTAEEVNPDLYRIDELYDEEYRVVFSDVHPLSKLDRITLADLANTTMLDRPNCEMRDTLQQVCADQGHSLYASYRSNRAGWLIELAKQGSGFVILPTTAIPVDLGILSRPIEGIDISRKVTAVRYRHQISRIETNAIVRELSGRR